MNGTAPPGSLSEGAVTPKGLTEGVYLDEWYSVKSFAFRRGDENRPPTWDFSEHPDEWNQPFPAPSLRELSSECETEGVYFDERNRSKISEFICAGE